MTDVPTTEIGEREGEGLVAVLQFLDGALDDAEHVLEGDATIGRDPGCTIVIPPSWSRVSGLHARLLIAANGARSIEDAGSKGGTFLNEKRLDSSGRAVLRSGDVLRFGVAGPQAKFTLRSAQYRSQQPEETYGIVLNVARGEAAAPRMQFENRPLITIGRDPDCDVLLGSAGAGSRVVSKRHARIVYRGGEFVLEDLDSANGTLVGGEAIRTATLKEGDIIEVGAGGPTVVVERIVGRTEAAAEVERQVSRRWRYVAAGIAAAALVLAGLAWWRTRDPGAGATDDGAADVPVDDRVALQALEKKHRAAVLLVYSRFELRRGEETLYSGDTFGSAFAVSPDGLVVSNRHVVQPWLGVPEYALALKRARAEHNDVEIVSEVAAWPDGTDALTAEHGLEFTTGFNSHVLANLRVVGFPPQHTATVTVEGEDVEIVAPDHTDLALLRLQGLEIAADAVPLLAEDDDPLAPLDPVVSLGYPHGEQVLEGTTARVSPTLGVVRKIEETIQLDASTFPGNSGGPVLSRAGKVIGVTTRRYGEGLAVCIPAAKVRALLRRHIAGL